MPYLATPSRSYFTSPVKSVMFGEDLAAAYALILGADIGCVAVLSAGKVVGLVSRNDLLRLGSRQGGTYPEASVLTLPHHPVEEIMTPVITVTEDDSLRKAAQLMVQNEIHRVFLVNADGEPVGVISTRDLMMAVRDQRMSEPVEQFMDTPVATILDDEPISEAVKRLEEAQIAGLAVVHNDWPVGVFTQRDALLSKELDRSTPIEEAMDPAVLIVPPMTSMHRMSALACAMRARRILVVSGKETLGVITGFTFAKAVAHTQS